MPDLFAVTGIWIGLELLLGLGWFIIASLIENGRIDVTPAGVQGVSSSSAFLMGALAVHAASLLAAVAIGFSWRRLNLREFGFTPLGQRWIWAGVGAAMALRVLLIPVLLALEALGVDVSSDQVDQLLPEGGLGPVEIAMLVGFAGVIIPFAEEALFRGVHFSALRKWGFAVAAVVSSALFGLAHFNLAVGLSAFMMGVVGAWFFHRSGSLWASIVIHTTFNLSGVLLLLGLMMFGVDPREV